VPGDYQVTSPFAALPLAWQQSINRLRWGGGVGICSIYFLTPIPDNALIPSNGLMGPPSSFNFFVPPYLPTLELIQMSRDPLPYPPQMRNGGSPPAHLSSSSDTSLAKALAKVQTCHAAAMEHTLATTAAAMMAATDLALEKMWAAMLAALAAANEANKHRRHKNAVRETALVDNAKAQCLQELAKCTAALVELVSAVERSPQELADRAAVSAETTLANKHRCQEAADCGATVGKTALAEEQCGSLLAAQGAVLVDMALPEPVLAEDKRHQEDAAAKHAQPCRCTDQFNRPRAPSLPDKGPPSHPQQMMGGSPTPTTTHTRLAQATSPCCSQVLSPPTSSMTPSPPCLLPFTFGNKACLPLGGWSAHPFH
jgi:hypothetical protein